jgi:hypothetical protein
MASSATSIAAPNGPARRASPSRLKGLGTRVIKAKITPRERRVIRAEVENAVVPGIARLTFDLAQPGGV